MPTSALIKKFFSRESIIDTMDRLPKLNSPALDLLYPEANRKSHPLPTLSYRDISPMAGNIPLVKRGSQSYKVGDSGSFSSIEPQPVNPSTALDAVDVNNLRALEQNGGNAQSLIDERIDGLRRICRDTAQALAIQSLTGKVSYDLRGPEGMFDKFTLDFGKPKVTVWPKLIDAPGTKLGDVVVSLSTMKASMQSQGFGNDVIYLASADVYAALINLLPNTGMPPIDAEGNLVLGANLKVRLFDYTYFDYTAKTAKGLAAKTLYAWDRSAGSKLVYAAVDDIEANFVASPFWAKAIPTPDPSGFSIIGQSKPVPIPNVKGICTSVVMS